MSYLHSPRLVFTGDFISDVSTVNNDPAHFNNTSFVASFQEYGVGGANGAWNPEGGANFSFQHCTISSVSMENDIAHSDPSLDFIVGLSVGGPNNRNTGKMVDLDPQWQGSSELWGVTFTIRTVQGEVVLKGDIMATGFRDLQRRQSSGIAVNGQPLGGTWTSVLDNIVWGEKADASPLLRELRSRTHSNRLSINLNVFGYYYAHAADGRFSMGRIIGTIGPWSELEPISFTLARRLYGVENKGSADQPIIFFGNSNFLFDSLEKRLVLDLGSSFPISDALGSISITEKLYLAVSRNRIDATPSAAPIDIDAADILMIGEVSYQSGPDWLNRTGGLVGVNDLPAPTAHLLEDHQLLLLRTGTSGSYTLVARESIDGLLVRADNFVNRLDPGQTNTVVFHASQWGRPLPNAEISITLEPPTSVTPGPICVIPGNNYPAEGLLFPSSIKTDENGRSLLAIKGMPIDNPRGYIDGQIYTLDYQLKDNSPDPAFGPFSNDNIFIHLRNYFAIPDRPAWTDIAPTLTQYSNLYPIMSKYLVNLADPHAVIQKKEILRFAFTRDITDPIYMPVTRDLSENKRLTILKWLDNPVINVPAAEISAAAGGLPQESPAGPDHPLTNTQLRLKNAVRAKNGSVISFREIDNLFK